VTWLGALIADTLIANLLGAVAGDVTKIAAVVAFGALSAITGHVSITTARVALSLAWSTESLAASESAAATSAAIAALEATRSASTTSLSTRSTASWAVASNVTGLATFVALGALKTSIYRAVT